MPGTASNGLSPSFDFLHLDKKHYRDFRRRNFIRLIFTYLAPLILISIYFYFQHGAIISEGKQLRLKAIAENQSNMFDLFLTERLNNLHNIVNDPRLETPPSQAQIDSYLGRLKNSSETFVDLGYFDETGVQKIYSGPYPSLEKKDYSNESWYVSLINGSQDFIITDIYLGFRQKPHFSHLNRKK